MIKFIILAAWALCAAFVIASFADSIIKEDNIIKRSKKVLGAGFFAPILLLVLIVINFVDNNTNINKK
jgi:hypothetical protein